tara:strand:- start:59569 stop:61992 length:2424 start_codon:yes stop_codon:yes gene_type:complete
MDISLNIQTLLESLFINFGMFAGLFTLLTILPNCSRNLPARTQQIIIGLIFGAAAALSIHYNVEIITGVHIDSRVAIISMAGLFFGPLTALVTIIPAILMRLTIDGEVALGIMVIITSALCGVLLRSVLYKTYKTTANLKQIALFALVMPLIIVGVALAFIEVRYFVQIATTYAPAFIIENFIAMFTLGTLLSVNSKNITLENNLDKAATLATTASSEKTEFIGMMSHEIRTPMSGVLGFTEILEQTDLDEYQRHCVEQVKTAGSTMMRLLDDILDFSRIESRKFSLSQDTVDLKETLRASFEMMQTEQHSNNNKMSITIDEDVPQYILGDIHRLKQIICNILGNAIKFTDQGTIDLHASFTPDTAPPNQERPGSSLTTQIPCKGTISIVISDTGIGIAPKKQSIIFSMFEQENSTIPHTYGGSGLGLAIVKSLVTLMGGDIEIYSRVGEGTAFTINLPYFTPPEDFTAPNMNSSDQRILTGQPAKTTLLDIDPVIGDNRFILLAEDVKMNQELTASILIQHGFQVHVANNGLEAIEAVKNNGPFHLVLMDINMPEMNGIDATNYIRETLKLKSEDLPIIALTAHVMGDEIQDCVQAGMDDYLSKPIKAAVLVEKVSSWAKPLGVDSFDSLLNASPATSTSEISKTPMINTQAQATPTKEEKTESAVKKPHIETYEEEDTFIINPFSGMTSETSPLIDIEMITQFIQFIGKDKITDVFKSFETDLELRIASMEKSDFDVKVIKFETHALASTSGNLGMVKLSLYCREIMENSDSSESDIDLIKSKTKKLREMSEASRAAFRKHVDEE